MNQPTNDTPCLTCTHKLGMHYKRYDGQHGCSGYTGQQDSSACLCRGFAVVYDPTHTNHPTHTNQPTHRASMRGDSLRG